MGEQTSLVAVDPRDGRVLADLTDEPTNGLAELVLALQAREADLKGWRELVEAELRDRLKAAGRKSVIAGGFEITYKPGRESVWDASETEAALADLVDRGAIEAAEAVGIIETRREVRRRQAKALLSRLTGEAKAILEDCCEWREKPHPTLTVTPTGTFEPSAPALSTFERAARARLRRGE